MAEAPAAAVTALLLFSALLWALPLGAMRLLLHSPVLDGAP